MYCNCSETQKYLYRNVIKSANGLFLEPTMTIHGGLERHIKYGSVINLTCEIRDYPGNLKFVIWYRDDKSLMKNPRYNIR